MTPTFACRMAARYPCARKAVKGLPIQGCSGETRSVICSSEYLTPESYLTRVLDDQGRHRKRKPPLEVMEGNHPALVSDELFQQVQDVLAVVNNNISYKNGKPVRLYPLTGILKCGYCGSRMRGENTFHGPTGVR